MTYNIRITKPRPSMSQDTVVFEAADYKGAVARAHAAWLLAKRPVTLGSGKYGMENWHRIDSDGLAVDRNANSGVPAREWLSKHDGLPRLFVACFPAGIVYTDRDIEEHGDYKRIAFLPYNTLKLDVDDHKSVLLAEVLISVADLQARRGESYPIAGNVTYTDAHANLEAVALDEFWAALATEIEVGCLMGYTGDSDSVEVYCDPPIRVMVEETSEDDILHWNQEHLDPYWNVNPVDPSDPRIAGLRSFYVDGPTHVLSGGSR